MSVWWVCDLQFALIPTSPYSLHIEHFNHLHLTAWPLLAFELISLCESKKGLYNYGEVKNA